MTRKKEYDIRTVGSEMFQQFYDGSYCTYEGAASEKGYKDWFDGVNKVFKEKDIGQIKTMYVFSGKDMNDFFKLTGTNAYPDDLHFISFPLDGLDMGRLAMFKMSAGFRWFDDIVDNNANRGGKQLHRTKSQEEEIEEEVEDEESEELDPLDLEISIEQGGPREGYKYTLTIGATNSSGCVYKGVSGDEIGEYIQRYLDDYHSEYTNT